MNATRRKPDQVYRYQDERMARAVAEGLNSGRYPRIESARVRYDRGLMIGPNLVRQSAWILEVYHAAKT